MVNDDGRTLTFDVKTTAPYMIGEAVYLADRAGMYVLDSNGLPACVGRICMLEHDAHRVTVDTRWTPQGYTKAEG